MNNWIKILGVLLVAGLVYCGIHCWMTREARAATQSKFPELIWLQREYELNVSQCENIEKLHRAHDVECQKSCKDLAGCQEKFYRSVVSQPVGSDAFNEALADWRKQRFRSQDLILKHMEDVSAEMEPEHGKRYRDRVFNRLLVPGLTPHIDEQGEFDTDFIRHLEE